MLVVVAARQQFCGHRVRGYITERGGERNTEMLYGGILVTIPIILPIVHFAQRL